jgi:hypothetical protein
VGSENAKHKSTIWNRESETKNFRGSNDKAHKVQHEPEGILENYGDKMGVFRKVL